MTYMAYGVKETPDLWVQMVLYFKYGAVFRPWIINWEVDVCAFMASKFKAQPMMYVTIEAMKRVVPHLIHKCPYLGNVGVEKINLADIYEKIVPQVIPRGTYKTSIRFYASKDNTTYSNLWGIAEVNAVEAIENFAIGK